jgi:hypothetical protein
VKFVSTDLPEVVIAEPQVLRDFFDVAVDLRIYFNPFWKWTGHILSEGGQTSNVDSAGFRAWFLRPFCNGRR